MYYEGISIFRRLGEAQSEVEALRAIGMDDINVELRLRDIDTVMRSSGMPFEEAVKFCQGTQPGWTLEPFTTMFKRQAVRGVEKNINKVDETDLLDPGLKGI